MIVSVAFDSHAGLFTHGGNASFGSCTIKTDDSKFEKGEGSADPPLALGVNGGEGGIRTLGTLASTPAFQAGTFDHSATSPGAG